MKCEDGCQKIVQVEMRSKLVSGFETNFFVVILSRAIRNEDGFRIVQNRTEEVFIR